MMHVHRVVTGIAVASVALLTRLAVAQPVRAPSPCAVDVVYAPDDVRAVVDEWVRAEPACRVALEARIIPTDGGFYLVVLDERGQVRERIVPDATSAGVLIASWAADDSILLSAPRNGHLALPPGPVLVPMPAPTTSPPASPGLDIPPAAPGPRVAIAPVVPPAPAGVAFAPGPIMVAVAPAPPAVMAVAARAPAADAPFIHRISVAALTEIQRDHDDGTLTGIRMEIDLWNRGSWSAGTALSSGRAETFLPGGGVRDWSLETTLLGYVRPSLKIGRLQLAPALGLGGTHSFTHYDYYGGVYHHTSWEVALLAEASLGGSLRIWRGVAIVVTPMVSATSRPAFGNKPSSEPSAHASLSLAGGLEWAW